VTARMVNAHGVSCNVIPAKCNGGAPREQAAFPRRRSAFAARRLNMAGFERLHAGPAPHIPGCRRPKQVLDRAKQRRSGGYGSWLVAPPLMNGESSTAPTAPPTARRRPGRSAREVRELRLPAAGARVCEFTAGGSLVDGDHEQPAVAIGA